VKSKRDKAETDRVLMR